MRLSCIVAMIVLGTVFWLPYHNSAFGQPYQKNWKSAGPPGAGSSQKHLGYPPDSVCPPPCPGKCYPPCEPDQPKDAVPDQPRSAVPGVAPGVFVAPPQSGVVEGPSRGFEIGNVSLTLPEISLGLPRLRWEGVKRLSRDARLMTDRAAAPYAANPYYAAALAEIQAREAARDATCQHGRFDSRQLAELWRSWPDSDPSSSCSRHRSAAVRAALPADRGMRRPEREADARTHS